jgi:hypothetical protein
MQPMGRRTVKFPGKTDCHPHNGYINWWEIEFNKTNKKTERQRAKKEIRKELDARILSNKSG